MLRRRRRHRSSTFPRLKFIGYNLDFSIDKAKSDLGYRPRVNFEEAIGETMDWYKKNNIPTVPV